MASYSIEALARKTGSTPRNIRAYQDRGLLSPPRREGRHAFYDDDHAGDLRLILQLLKRGYTLASIKDLMDARSKGNGLDGVLGVVKEATGAWSDEQPIVVPFEKLAKMFGASQQEALPIAIEIGLVEPHPNGVRVTSPRLLAVGVKLHESGVPLSEVLAQLRFLRTAMETIARQFVALTAEHIWSKFPRDPEGGTLPNVARRIRQLRPLAQESVDAELARAMRLEATRYLESIFGRGVKPAAKVGPSAVPKTKTKTKTPR